MEFQVKKILAGLFLSFLSSIVLLLVLELSFRFFRNDSLDSYLEVTMGMQTGKSCYLHTPNTTFRQKSSQKDGFDVLVRINKFGYRGEDISLEKDLLRIFAVGDSFTFGVGADENETIPYLIEENLKEQGMQVGVINAGKGHDSPLTHYLNLRDIHLKFNPDLVILFLDFTDLQDDWSREKSLIYDKNGKLLYIDHSVFYGKRSWWILLTKKSVFCKYINNKVIRTINKIKALGLRKYIVSKLDGQRAKAVICNLEESKLNIDPIEYDQFLLIRGRERLSYIKKHWARTEKYLLMIRDLLKENNIKLILVIYPHAIHVSPTQWAEGRIYWGFESNKTYADYYALELIEDFAKRNGIFCINTLDDFLKEKDKKLFFDLDGHLTPTGNHILANSITKNNNFQEILRSLSK